MSTQAAAKPQARVTPATPKVAPATPATPAAKEPTVSTVDVSKLSLVELNKLVQQAQEALALKRVEEIKVLADAYAKKATAAGYSIQEAIDALKPYLPATAAKKPRKPRAEGSSKKEQPFVRGTTYVDPEGKGKDWTAGGPGAKPQWLIALVDGLDIEAARAKYASVAKK